MNSVADGSDSVMLAGQLAGVPVVGSSSSEDGALAAARHVVVLTEGCRSSAYGESMGSKHPIIASAATDVIDGSRLLVFEGPATEIRVSLSVEEAQKLGRELAPEKDDSKLQGAEILFGFLGWLTSRRTAVTFSYHRDSSSDEAVELLERFCKTNGLSTDCRNRWGDRLTHPPVLEAERAPEGLDEDAELTDGMETVEKPVQLPEVPLEAFPVSAGNDPHPLTQSRMRGLMGAALEDVFFGTFMHDLIPPRPVSLSGLLYAAWIGGARSGSVRGGCYEGDWPESS